MKEKKMKKMIMPWLVVLILVYLIVIPVVILIYLLPLGIATIVLLWGGFILQGLVKIPASPPNKAAVTIFGERKRRNGKTVYRDEGWNFFPLRGLWYGYILIKVVRISFTISVEKTRTPDRANSKVPVFMTVRPFAEKLIEYIDSGQENGVKEQLTGKIQERVREWAMAEEEGPADWEELNKSQLEATSVLVTRIASNSLTSIPPYAQDVPTFIWLRYYSKPRPQKYFKNEEFWSKNDWREVEKVLERINKIQVNEDSLLGENRELETPEQHLKKAVEKRRQEIKDLRAGSGKIVIDDLGVTLERLNIGDIDVIGGVGEQAEKQAKEEEERKGEALELEYVRERIKELMEPPFEYSKEQALEIVQTERGKVTKTIDEKKLSISSETCSALGKVITEMKSISH